MKRKSSRSKRNRIRRNLRKTKARNVDYQNLEPRQMLAGFNVDFGMLDTADYTHTEILVRFSDNVDVQTARQHYEGGFFGPTSLPGPVGEGFRSDTQLFEVLVGENQSVPELVNFYNSLDSVDYAEPNYRMVSTAVPNDQHYGVQWGPGNMNAEAAWDVRTDSSSVTVAVIDSGVEYTHADLAGNIWTNSGEIAGNGIDDDSNGYVDDVYGYDFDNDDNNPIDDHGHGTHVAGTIGASGNNSIGVAGMGWNANIMSLKVIGNGSNADVARAIDYAVDNGAKITNNSYGYHGTNVGRSQVMSDAIGRAKNAGVLYIVAAGNSSTGVPAQDLDGNFNSWPAEESKTHDNVITVASIDENGSLSSFSHWGDQSVQIAAPGGQIASTYLNGGYVYNSGTSMATPHVAGAAALLWAERPDLDYLGIKSALLDNARAELLSVVGDGVLDLGASMAAIANTNNLAPTAVNDAATVAEDGSVAVSVLGNDTDPENDTLTVTSFSTPANGSVSNSNNVLTYTPNANYNGSDSFTYTISDGNNNSDVGTVNITVNPVNDAPTVSTAIADVSVLENAANTVLNLSGTFSDIDNASLTLSVQGNTNGSLVSASMSGSNLTLDYATTGTGTADITVRATDSAGLFVDDTFTVTVTPVGSGGTQTFTNTNNVNISSSGTPTVTSDIVVSGMTGTIDDVNMEIDISHTYDSDLDVTLIAPDGTRVNLFTDVGGSANNFTNTVLDDQAATAINSASAPFTGTFRPENDALSTVNGKNPNGTWQLEIKDDANLDGGTLNDWSITITSSVSTSNTQTFSNNTNVAISSSGTPTVTSNISVSGMTQTISDVNLAFNITHTYVSDLDVTLIAPNGTRINLFTDIGGSANNFVNTVLDDEAGSAINSASAPFTGTFRPENDALSLLDGLDPNGTWTLEIRDDANLDGGSLDDWSITITTG